jgi:hypothetical protein
VQKPVSRSVETNISRIRLGRFVVQASPDIIGIVAFDLSLARALADNHAEIVLVLLNEPKFELADLCRANRFHASGQRSEFNGISENLRRVCARIFV